MIKRKKKQTDTLMEEIDFYLDPQKYKFKHFEFYSLTHKKSLKRIDTWVKKKLLKGAGLFGTIILIVYFFYKSAKVGVAKTASTISTKMIISTLVATTVVAPPAAYYGHKIYKEHIQDKKQDIKIIEKNEQKDGKTIKHIQDNKKTNDSTKDKTKEENAKKQEPVYRGIKEIDVKSNFLSGSERDAIKWLIKSELKRSKHYNFEAKCEISQFADEYYIFYKLNDLQKKGIFYGEEKKVKDKKQINEAVRELSRKLFKKHLQ